MSQDQIVCPACQMALVLPQGMMPQKSAQCLRCGQLINLYPVNAPQPVYNPLAQQSFGAPNQQLNSAGWHNSQQPQKKGGSKLGLILGISIGGSVALVALIVLVVVLSVSGSSSDSDAGDDTASVDSDKHAAPGSIEDFFGGSSTANPSATGARPSRTVSFGSTTPFDRQPDYQPSLAETRYKLSSGEKFAIEYEYSAKLLSTTSTLRGTVTYEATDRSASDVVSDQEYIEKAGEGNGTGFVVRPDGYLVTNAHVVQGATSIVAHLDGKDYPAKVVAMDVKNDLAIIRINANNIPHLTIHDSDRVRLAEEVRALGFPMVSQLGESIKITRGTISGVTEQSDSKMFQLDVTVNRGNSGGPLVNDKGQVVGVITALMAGDDIADMSFAVTSNDVRRLMKSHKLEYESADGSAAVMSGPDLADRVRRSVALLRVKVGPGGIGIAEKKVINYQLTWFAQDRSSNGRPGRPVGGRENGIVLVSSSGEIAYCDGKKTLPAQLGLVATLGLQPLSDDGSSKWHSVRLTMVSETRSVKVPTSTPNDSYPRGYSRYDWRNRSPPRTRTSSTVKLHPAIEMTKFEILDASGDLLNIKKLQELVTIGDSKTPHLRVTGSGSFQFDRRKGLPVSLDVNGTLADSDSQIPFVLKFKSTDADQLVKRQAESAERAKQLIAEIRGTRVGEDAKNVVRVDAATIPISRGLPQLDLSE